MSGVFTRLYERLGNQHYDGLSQGSSRPGYTATARISQITAQNHAIICQS
jgi:hypothetical protein